MTIVEPKAATAPTAAHDPHTPARSGCTPICTMDHTQPGNNPGWCAGPAVQCQAPAPYGTTLPGESPESLMSARVVTVNDLPEIFGITTKLWVDVPGDVLELDLAQTDTLIDALEDFLPQLRAARAQLVETAKGDRPRNPEAAVRWHAERAARERAAFPRLVIDTRELPQGAPVVYYAATDQALGCIAWDPAQTTRDKVETYISTHVTGTGAYVEYTPAVADALRGFEAIRRSDPDPKVIETWDTVEQAVIASIDPKAACLRIADLLAAENAEVTA